MRILILSASAGFGHVRAAAALEAEARRIWPAGEIRNVDILDFTDPLYRKAYAASYLKLADRAPELWGYLYNVSDRKRAEKRTARLVRAFDRIEFARFRAMVREFAPDHVFCTHFLPAQTLRPYRDRDWHAFGLHVCVTDFLCHGYWAQPNADKFFVASMEGAEELALKGIPRARIHEFGIPVMEAFSRTNDREGIRREMGLDPGLPTVLAMSGGWGAAGMPHLVRALFDAGPVQVLAVCGRNERMLKRVQELKAPAGSRLLPLGFVNNIHELMSVADLCVSKSGGLTCSECAAIGVPLLIPSPIPGQEERNAIFFTEHGAALIAHSEGSLRFKAAQLLADRKRMRAMGAAARALGKPFAARDVLRTATGT
jgi:processive 1,2-diacylglycerol beta-glucosyltransferase